MRIINIQPIANQSFTTVLNAKRYDFTIKETRGSMSITVIRDNIVLASGLRVVPDTPILPYPYLMDGNFFLLTENQEYPDYRQFGITQQLIYLTPAEVATYEREGLKPYTAYSPSLTFNFITTALPISQQGFELHFIRASEGSYFNAEGIMEYAVNDIPRFDYNPVSLQAEGLLIEGISSNICLYSEAANDGTWVKTNSSISVGTAVAPDGETTGNSLVDDSTNGVHTITQNLSFTDGEDYTFSVFLKRNTRAVAKIALPASAFPGTPYCFINLITGELGTPQDCTAIAQQLPNDWWRIAITVTADATATGDISIGTALDITTDSYIGDGGNIFVWGAQVEELPVMTSYIPTINIPAIREADQASISTSGWLASATGTFYSSAKFAYSGILSSRTMAELNDETVNNTLHHFINGSDSDKRTIMLNSGGVAQYDYEYTSYTANEITKSATAYRENGVTGAIDGVLSPFDDEAVIPVFTHLSLGNSASGTTPFYGWIREIQYYIDYLDNIVLQGMTE